MELIQVSCCTYYEFILLRYSFQLGINFDLLLYHLLFLSFSAQNESMYCATDQTLSKTASSRYIATYDKVVSHISISHILLNTTMS